MSSIFGTLSVASEALQVHQLALETTQRNIANVNTPGYTRQRANIAPGSESADGGTTVTIASVDAFRERFVDYRISQELQTAGRGDAELAALRRVEILLNESGGQGLQAAISAFFASLSALSAAPEDMALRRQVLTSADAMAGAFRQLSERLIDAGASQDLAVRDTVGQINELTARIARLNVEIASVTDGLTGTGPQLIDQRQQALEKLSELVDISYFETESGAITVMTRGGGLLVVDDSSHALSTVPSGGRLAVHLDGADITASIRSGRLGGILNVRDDLIPGYSQQLDEIAAALISRINIVHAQGVDYNGVPGVDLFTPYVPPAAGSVLGAASSISVAISDPRLIAAASPGAGPGSNGNVSALAAIADETLLASGSETILSYYSSLVYRVGTDTRSALDNVQTQAEISKQLQNQRDSLTGVSLDEEAVNIIRYQKAYQASARFVSVIDELTTELVQLLG